MNDPIQALIERLPLLHLNHISVCLTLRERGERARRLWTRRGMPISDAARLSEYWKKRAATDPALARRIIGLYLEHYSKSGDPNRRMECDAHPENQDLLGLLQSPGPYVEKSIRRVVAGALGQPSTPRVSPPPIATQLAAVSKSLVNWAVSGLKTVPPEELDRRRAICAECEFWDSSAFQGTGRCQKCGCSTWAKLQMATEKCPIDKWGPV
jgi:hypothetical protein